jgi:hypothetical protein
LAVVRRQEAVGRRLKTGIRRREAALKRLF